MLACSSHIGNMIHVDVGALAPRKADVPQAATYGSRHSTASPSETAAIPETTDAVRTPTDASASLQVRSGSRKTSHGDGLLREPNLRAHLPRHRPTPALLDEHGNLQFHVEKPLSKESSSWSKPVIGKVVWVP